MKSSVELHLRHLIYRSLMVTCKVREPPQLLEINVPDLLSAHLQTCSEKVQILIFPVDDLCKTLAGFISLRLPSS